MPFDRESIKTRPLSERIHDLDISCISPIDPGKQADVDNDWGTIARKIASARAKGAPIIMMMGGHVIRSGVQNYIIDLMKRGYISCLSTNGSGMIHDFEFALIGSTTESVARYIREGQFGLWKETGTLNEIINAAYARDRKAGMGEAVGLSIQNGDYPHKDISLFASAHRLNIPATVHVGIGYDIIHEYPNCDGAATGALSYNDFLVFAGVVQRLEGGVLMNFGSSVMAPEVFLKALSMARNVAHQQGKSIKNFTTVVCDLHELPRDFSAEPDKRNPAYYFRPWKTMLIRTVADGGSAHYIRGRHAETIPALWAAINWAEKK